MRNQVPISFKRLLSLLLAAMMLLTQFSGVAGAISDGSEEMQNELAQETVSVSAVSETSNDSEQNGGEDPAPAQDQNAGDTTDPQESSDPEEGGAAQASDTVIPGEDGADASASATDAETEDGDASDSASGEPSVEAANGDVAAKEAEMNILPLTADGDDGDDEVVIHTEYRLYLNANGGNFIGTSQQSSDQFQLPNEGLYASGLINNSAANNQLVVRKGYIFTGYFTEKTGGTMVYDETGKFMLPRPHMNGTIEEQNWDLALPRAETILYAHWAINSTLETDAAVYEFFETDLEDNEKVYSHRAWESDATNAPVRNVKSVGIRAITPDLMNINGGSWERDEMKLVIENVVGPDGVTVPATPQGSYVLSEEYHYMVTFSLTDGKWKSQKKVGDEWQDASITVPIYIDRTAPVITWTYTDGNEFAPGVSGSRINYAEDPAINNNTKFLNTREGVKVTFKIEDQSLPGNFTYFGNQHFTLVDTKNNSEYKLETQVTDWVTLRDSNNLVTGYQITFDLDVPDESGAPGGDATFTFDDDSKTSHLYYVEFNRPNQYSSGEGLEYNSDNAVEDLAGNRSDADKGKTVWMRSDTSDFEVVIRPLGNSYHPSNPDWSRFKVFDGLDTYRESRVGITCSLVAKASGLTQANYGEWLTLKVDGQEVTLPTFTQQAPPNDVEWIGEYVIFPDEGEVNRVHTIELIMKDPNGEADAEPERYMLDNLVIDDTSPTIEITTDDPRIETEADFNKKYVDYPELTVTVRDLSPDKKDGESDADIPTAGVVYEPEVTSSIDMPNAPLFYVVSDNFYDVTALYCNGTPLELDEEHSDEEVTVSMPMPLDVKDGVVSKTLKFTATKTFRGTIHFWAADLFGHDTPDHMDVVFDHETFSSDGKYIRIVLDSIAPEVVITKQPDSTGLPGYTNGVYDSTDQNLGFNFEVSDESLAYPETGVTVTYTKDGGEPVAFESPDENAAKDTTLYTFNPWEGFYDYGDGEDPTPVNLREGTNLWKTDFDPTLLLKADSETHANDGRYIVTISAKDDVGNHDPEKSVKVADPIIIDTKRPTVSISQPQYVDSTRTLVPEPDGNVYANGAVQYELRISDLNISKSDFFVTGENAFESVKVSIDGDSELGGSSFEFKQGYEGYTLSDWKKTEEKGPDGGDVWMATLTVDLNDGQPHVVVVGLEARDKAYNTSEGSIATSETARVSGNTGDVAWGAFSDHALVSSRLIFDSTAPEIKIDRPSGYSGIDSENGTTNYYSNAVGHMRVNITVTDDSIVWNGSRFMVGDIKITVLDKNGQGALPANFNVGTWRQDGDSPILTNYVTFNAPTDGEVEYYIHVEARDGTAQKLPSEDSADKGNTRAMDSTDEAAVDGKKYGYLILDTVRPVVTFEDSGYYGSGQYGTDFYSDTSGAANSPSTAENDATYNIYKFDGSKDLHVTVSVTDTHISLTDTVTESAKVTSAERIKVFRFDTLEQAKAFSGNGGTRMTQGKEYRVGTWISKSNGTVWQNTVTLTADAEQGYYVVTANWRDKAANDSVQYEEDAASSAAHILVNDLTSPSVTSVVAGKTNETEQTQVFKGKDAHYTNEPGADGGLKVTYTMSDNNYIDTSAGSSAFSFTVYKYDTSGNRQGGFTAGYGEIVGDGGWETSGDESTITYHLTTAENGIYTVAVTVTDLAGNTTVHESDFLVVDTEAPNATITSRGASGEERWSSNAWAEFLSTITFGLFSNDSITTTLAWPDKTDSTLNAQHGTEYAWYYVQDVETHADALADADAVEAAATASESGWIALDTTVASKEFSFTSDNNKKYIVYFKVTDRAGNTRIISSDGLITEGDRAVFTEEDGTEPEIHITEDNAHIYLDNEGIHDTSVTMDLEATEYPEVIYSGIDSDKTVYTVSDGRDEGAEPVGVTDEADPSARISVTTSDLEEPEDSDGLIPKRNESVTITVGEGYESDQLRLSATVVDNSGNSKTVEYEDLNIDNRTPTATATYDNNTVYNEKYFNDSRTATLVIQEMNFSPEYTKVTTQGTVSEWTIGEPAGMETRNTATVTFTQDGDYTIAVETTDKAGHTMTDSFVDYGSSAAPREFVIDKTAPTVEIRFTDENGNEIPSGSYFSGTVMVTITVTEHNFDESSATSGLQITRDGQPVTLPVSWSSNGDSHVATLTITEEEGAYYTFNMNFVDLANNPNSAFQQVDFYVDTMGPSVVMTEIGHNSANNGDVIAPVLTITDKYYDLSSVTVTITGVKHGELTDAYDVVEIENGQQYLFHNLEEDDIYTITVIVTDLAGNTTTLIYSELTDESVEEFVFSVNRGGSTFTTDDGTTEVLATRYMQSVDDDLVITIVNVDTIEKMVLTLTRDGIARELVEGTDYEVSMKEILGGYEYTVTVYKSNFTEDGEYELSIYTLDRAGNESTNVITDVAGAAGEGGVEIKLGVDTEAPAITLDEIEKGIAYAFENYEGGSLIVTDNQSLDEVKAVLTYADGTEVTYTWEADEIYTEPFTGTYQAKLTGSRAIAQSNHRINIRVYARDKAGNEFEGPYSEGESGLYLDTEYDFYVSTSIFTRIFANKPLFFGLIGGVVLLGGGGAAATVVIRKKKKTAAGGSDDSNKKSKKAGSHAAG